MRADAEDSGGRENEIENRDWRLRCQGWRVIGPTGEQVGVVAGVLYDFSARWDHPRGLAVRDAAGRTVEVPASDIAAIDAKASSVRLSAWSLHHA